MNLGPLFLRHRFQKAVQWAPCLLFVWLTGVVWAVAAPAAARHEPRQPKPGEAVRITAEFPTDKAPSAASLEYQIVEPGKYLAKSDPKFSRQWVSVPMTNSGPGKFSAELPSAMQQNRRLVRYRIRSAKEGPVLLPPADDATGNFGYFVYAGVPAWHGAVDPKGSAANRNPVAYSPEVLTQVPVYHLLAARSSVENATWKDRVEFGDEEARHAYKYTGTLVYDGVVYDHVKFRARGGEWRHAMGKNMWKFNFNPGNRFAARDYYGRSYKSKWDKLNLGACIQQGDTRMRGELGMFEAVTYRLFNLAGVEAPRTHWVHFRVITDAEETPKDQYEGDFWGLYLATEEVDGDFLKEHGLPDGNTYKMQFLQPRTEHLAKGAPADQADIRRFLQNVTAGGRRAGLVANQAADSWWEETVDLPRYYSYRTILECVHHYDLDAGKNYYFYHNLAAKRWQVIPWDVDLSWGDHMYGGGREIFFATGLLRRSPFREAYQARLAELRDLLFNSEQTGRLIDEYAAMIADPKGGPSLADADRAKWDYHPIMSSPHVDAGKSQPGLFYFGKPEQRFEVMPALMKAYVSRRQSHLDRLLTGYNPPTTPEASGPDSIVSSAATIPIRPVLPAETTATKLRWRLAEVTDPTSPTFDPRQPWHYEIESLGEGETGVVPLIDVPVKSLTVGHTYRVRICAQAEDGRWSRWSRPVQLTVR